MVAYGCEEPSVVGPSTTPPPTASASSVDGGTQDDSQLNLQDGQVADAEVEAGLVYNDEDFVEVDIKNRDPFRNFSAMFQRTVAETQVTRYVKMPTLSVEDMRLIAIVTRTPRPYAMVIDSQRVGHIIEVRDYIGRPEVIQTGGSDSMPIQLNWRVDRIREGEVLLAREDPTAPNQPPVMRVMLLHPVDQPATSRGIVRAPTTQTDFSSGGSPGAQSATTSSLPSGPAQPAPSSSGPPPTMVTTGLPPGSRRLPNESSSTMNIRNYP